MFKTEEPISKKIIADGSEDEFQIRYINGEDVGLVTTRSGKSYFILDSKNYWYDLIQSEYPAKRKCSCKNDWFNLSFNFIPRAGTDDYRGVELLSCCTECGKQRKFAYIDIDYSPTGQLFKTPLTYCSKPKIKYKLQSISGYWGADVFDNLLSYLSQRTLIFALCRDFTKKDAVTWELKRIDADELKQLVRSIDELSFMQIYFSMIPLEGVFCDNSYARSNIWRKKDVIMVNRPFEVFGRGYFYSIDCCSEYVEAGRVVSKSDAFCGVVQDFLAYFKEKLSGNKNDN